MMSVNLDTKNEWKIFNRKGAEPDNPMDKYAVRVSQNEETIDKWTMNCQRARLDKSIVK